MAKTKPQDPETEAQDAPEEEIRKATPEEIAEFEKQFEPVGYELLDPRTANVSHNGKIYTAQNGRLDCPPEVAQELIKAGVLKG